MKNKTAHFRRIKYYSFWIVLFAVSISLAQQEGEAPRTAQDPARRSRHCS